MPSIRDFIMDMEGIPAVRAAAAAAAAKRNEVESSPIESILPVMNMIVIHGRKYYEE
jgi:hypothetical protein